MYHPAYTAGFTTPPIHDIHFWNGAKLPPYANSTDRAKARRVLKRQYARDQYAAALAKYKAMTPEQRKHESRPAPLKIEDRGTCTYQLSGRTAKMIFGDHKPRKSR